MYKPRNTNLNTFGYENGISMRHQITNLSRRLKLDSDRLHKCVLSLWLGKNYIQSKTEALRLVSKVSNGNRQLSTYFSVLFLTLTFITIYYPVFADLLSIIYRNVGVLYSPNLGVFGYENRIRLDYGVVNLSRKLAIDSDHLHRYVLRLPDSIDHTQSKTEALRLSMRVGDGNEQLSRRLGKVVETSPLGMTDLLK